MIAAKEREPDNFSAARSDELFTCQQLLFKAGLDKTTWGLSIIEAEKQGGFSELDRHCVQFMWPFDEEFADAVLSDRIGPATIRLIEIEKSIADHALANYRKRPDPK